MQCFPINEFLMQNVIVTALLNVLFFLCIMTYLNMSVESSHKMKQNDVLEV